MRPSFRDRAGNYFATKGWAHVVLLSGLMVFLMPLIWMLGMSLKTDEETAEETIFPAVPVFRASSPFVREVAPPTRPPDVSAELWNARRPLVERVAAAAVDPAPLPPGAQFVDAHALREAARKLLIRRIVARLDARMWFDASDDLLARHARAFLTPEAVADALSSCLHRLEIQRLQLRTNSGRILNLVTGSEIARTWNVVSGPGELAPGGIGASILRYDFSSDADAPIVLRYHFAVPPDAAAFHKLTVTAGCDDSWHRIDARFTLGDRTYVSDRTHYIAQHRPASIVYQPWGFDDTTYRPKTWITLVPNPPRVASPATAPARPGEPAVSATLELTISPSSTLQAVWGKLKRNYERSFYAVPFWTYIGNSILLVGLQLAGALFSASFVAYAFARLNWPGRSVAFALLLSTMMLPGQVTMIPSFMIWREIGWYNTLNPLWVPAWFGSAFFIFLMTQHMRTIPRELEEAARIDGLNAVQTWWYVILPQVKPVLAAIAVMTFMGAWNDFMGPLIMLRDQSKFPLSLGLFGMRIDQGGDWSLIMAGNMLMTLPVILIFFFFQRYFIQGVTMTGMKG